MTLPNIDAAQSDSSYRDVPNVSWLSVAVKKGAILAPLAPSGPAAFWNEPFSPPRRRNSERPGAVKGAPLLDAAKRTLDGEDRSARLGRREKGVAKN
jgi:hypothetical protein